MKARRARRRKKSTGRRRWLRDGERHGRGHILAGERSRAYQNTRQADREANDRFRQNPSDSDSCLDTDLRSYPMGLPMTHYVPWMLAATLAAMMSSTAMRSRLHISA